MSLSTATTGIRMDVRILIYTKLGSCLVQYSVVHLSFFYTEYIEAMQLRQRIYKESENQSRRMWDFR